MQKTICHEYHVSHLWMLICFSISSACITTTIVGCILWELDLMIFCPRFSVLITQSVFEMKQNIWKTQFWKLSETNEKTHKRANWESSIKATRKKTHRKNVATSLWHKIKQNIKAPLSTNLQHYVKQEYIAKRQGWSKYNIGGKVHIMWR